LLELNLNYNRIGPVGVGVFAKRLSCLTQLTTLELRGVKGSIATAVINTVRRFPNNLIAVDLDAYVCEDADGHVLVEHYQSLEKQQIQHFRDTKALLKERTLLCTVEIDVVMQY
jgi:hypothetical protein